MSFKELFLKLGSACSSTPALRLTSKWTETLGLNVNDYPLSLVEKGLPAVHGMGQKDKPPHVILFQQPKYELILWAYRYYLFLQILCDERHPFH